MAQKRKQKSWKWVSWFLLLVLAITAGVVVYLVWGNYFSDKKEDGNEQETAQIDKAHGEEEGVLSNNEEVVEKKKIEQYEGEDPNDKDSLSGVVTYAGVNGGMFMIRVNIDQYLETGECSLKLLRGDTTIYSSIVEVNGGPSTASCAGFDVPVNEIGEGMVKINIDLSSDGRSGLIVGEANL